MFAWQPEINPSAVDISVLDHICTNSLSYRHQTRNPVALNQSIVIRNFWYAVYIACYIATNLLLIATTVLTAVNIGLASRGEVSSELLYVVTVMTIVGTALANVMAQAKNQENGKIGNIDDFFKQKGLLVSSAALKRYNSSQLRHMYSLEPPAVAPPAPIHFPAMPHMFVDSSGGIQNVA